MPLAGGKAGVDARLGRTMAEVPAGATADGRLAFAASSANRPTRPGDAERLASGPRIGSGRGEGEIERLANLRRKRTGRGGGPNTSARRSD